MKKQRLLLYGWILSAMVVGCGIVALSVSAQDFREFPPRIAWKQIETDHFQIVFSDQSRAAAQRVAAMAERIHQQVTEFLEYTPGSKTYVILTDHVDASNGYATPIPSNKIVLFLREPGAGGSFFGLRSPDWLALVFTHEYVHIVQLDMAAKWYRALRKLFGRVVFPNASLPLWMIEGLAVYAETKWQDGRGRHPHYDMLMRTEILEEKFKPLDQMSAVRFRKWPMGTVYYLYGYFFMQYLADTYGEESLMRLNQANVEKFPMFGKNIFKNVFAGKNERKLWKEWRDAMHQRYERQIADIRADPVTESRPLTTSGYFTNSPAVSPDGEYVYYVEHGPHAPEAFVQLRLSDGTTTRLTEGSFSGNFSLSADGQQGYFCKTDLYHTFAVVSDLYVLDMPSGKVRRLTYGQRAFDPAVSPDGKTLVFTTTHAGNMTLMRMELDDHALTPIWQTDDHTQIAHPTFSADGERIALQLWKEGGFQDIYIMNSDGAGLTALTFDRASDASPVWGLHDDYIFFSSDRTGVPNIFAYALNDKMLYQATNVLTGAFNPEVTPDGAQLVYEQYSGNGMDIHLAAINRTAWKPTTYAFEQLPEHAQSEARMPSIMPDRPYQAIPSLLPKFWTPIIGQDEDGMQLGVMTGGRDVLGQHSYFLSGLYGLKSERLSVYGEYTNMQFFPAVTLFGSDRAAAFTDIFANEDGNSATYWQREQLIGVDIQTPLYASLATTLSLSTGYRYKTLSSLNEPAPEILTPVPDEGVLSGFSVGMSITHLNSSIYAISPENGILASLTYRRDAKTIGSDYDLHTVVGDARCYVQLPKLRHHVLTLRTIGGVSAGDTLTQGVFQLGGYYVNSSVAALDQQHFYLRGYGHNALIGNRFALASAEYRFPIWYPQRGLAKGWLFFDSMVGTLFYDVGNAWTERTRLRDFKHGVGGELRINIGFQYNALPMTFRFGFAQGLDDDLGQSQFICAVAFDFWL